MCVSITVTAPVNGSPLGGGGSEEERGDEKILLLDVVDFDHKLIGGDRDFV